MSPSSAAIWPACGRGRAARPPTSPPERGRRMNATDGRLPVVGVVMGSDSDWPVMTAAADALAEFGVRYEADVVSAHRMPQEMISYGSHAADRGLRVLIAG